jgi:hypothetical protein
VEKYFAGNTLLAAALGLLLLHPFSEPAWAQVASGKSVATNLSSQVEVPISPEIADALPGRDLAPGVLTVIHPDQNAEDTAIGPNDLDFVAKHPELAWNAPEFEKSGPNFAAPSETLLEMGKRVTLRHPVWALEFAFKPVRMIEADLPNKSGRLERRLVWYLVYRIRYVGGDLIPELEQVESGTGVAKSPKQGYFQSVRFLPRFTFIETQTKVERSSKILSTVIPSIAERERVGKPLLDEIQISRKEIKPSIGDQENAVWGVATWLDIPPETDFFLVQIRGLSNAYKLQIDPSGEKSYLRKTLQIHFWRPGDSVSQAEDRIRLGVPAFLDKSTQEYTLKQFGLEKRLAYQWVYR